MLSIAFAGLATLLVVLLYLSERRRRLAERERDALAVRGNGRLTEEAGRWRRWE